MEVLQVRICCPHHVDMDRVGIRKQYQPVAGGNCAKKRLRHQGRGEEYGTPDLAEFFVAALQVEQRREFLYEIARGNLAGFEAIHESCGPDARRDLFGGNAGEGGNAGVAAAEIERYDNAPQIENDGFDQLLLYYPPLGQIPSNLYVTALRWASSTVVVMCVMTWPVRAACLALISAVSLPADSLLEQGYRQMYNLNFAAAHRTFADFERANPTNAMGPVSDAAAYLFTEFDRLDILRSDYLTRDESFFVVNKPKPGDPDLKKKFETALGLGDQLATARLKQAPTDADAMLASTMRLGLHANYLAMIEKKNLAALSEVKESTALAQKLLAAHPEVYDGYIAQGIENYLLSQKNAAVRWFLRLGGAQTDKQVGIEKTTITAEKGHYFMPYARLLLAIQELRDNNRVDAKQKLTWLAAEYPGNHLYRDELERLVIAK